MRKKIALMTLVLFLTGSAGNVYANTDGTTTPNSVTSNDEVLTTVVNLKEIENSAGVLPNSNFYSLERKVEELQIAITQSEEKLATLKAQFATERAAETVIMVNDEEEELANEAATEYMEMLASATAHLNNAIEAKEEAVQTLETLNESYKVSEEILTTLLEKAPESAKTTIENALNEQDKANAAVNGFYAAKGAFFAAKKELEAAKQELETAKKSGNAEAIRLAEEKVKAAEALKDELEELKDAADTAKETVKPLVEQVEKRIELGMKQVEKANEKIEKVEEKALEDSKKIEEKSSEAIKKAEEKAREEAKKLEEKAREEAKKAEEKAREEAKKAEEKNRD